MPMKYRYQSESVTLEFASLKELLAKATPLRSGDVLAGVAAESEAVRIIAQKVLSEVPLQQFLEECVIPYETDEVTRLILDTHDKTAFSTIAGFSVGMLRDWLLSDEVSGAEIQTVSRGITPEMAAAVCKLLRLQELVTIASKIEIVSRFRNTIGRHGTFSVRLQPNHPTDDLKGIAASTIDGLLYGCGDAVIGVNPATDSVENAARILDMLDNVRSRYGIPTQTCVLTHVTNSMKLIKLGVPVDLTFQSIAGTEAANTSFGVSLSLLKEAHEATLQLGRGTVGNNVMYFETGQGSALSANAHWGVDQQTLEARAYAVARVFDPFLVNTVVGFIGPEYLYNGKQIIRAGLEDHFCGKLLGLPMGVDVCYTNHAEADQDDMDVLLTLLGVANCNFVMGIPGADDIMLNYQSTSFHDALYLRRILGKTAAPEFEDWLRKSGVYREDGTLQTNPQNHPLLRLGLSETAV